MDRCERILSEGQACFRTETYHRGTSRSYKTTRLTDTHLKCIDYEEIESSKVASNSVCNTTTVRVRQSCILSPSICHIFSELTRSMVWRVSLALLQSEGGKESLGFADDIDLIAGSKENLTDLTTDLPTHRPYIMTWKHIEASRETVLYNQERKDTASEIRVGKKCCMIDMKRNLCLYIEAIVK